MLSACSFTFAKSFFIVIPSGIYTYRGRGFLSTPTVNYLVSFSDSKRLRSLNRGAKYFDKVVFFESADIGFAAL